MQFSTGKIYFERLDTLQLCISQGDLEILSSRSTRSSRGCSNIADETVLSSFSLQGIDHLFAAFKVVIGVKNMSFGLNVFNLNLANKYLALMHIVM